MVDFLLVLIGLLSPALMVEALGADIGRNCGFERGVDHFEHKFQSEGGRPPTNFGVIKLRVPGLSCGVVCVILRLAVLVQYRRVTCHLCPFMNFFPFYAFVMSVNK